MEKRIVYLSIFSRIFCMLIELSILYGVIFFLLKHEYTLALLFFMTLLLLLPFPVITFVQYIFTTEKIAIKFPLFKIKECSLDDIIGYAFESIQGNRILIIYTQEMKIIIRADGKKLRQEAYNFIEKYHEIIKNKNQEELRSNGIIIKINKKTEIKFYGDYLERIYNGIKEKYFYKDLIVKYLGITSIKLLTNNNIKIYFNIIQSKGNIGLFDHLLNYKWENKKI